MIDTGETEKKRTVLELIYIIALAMSTMGETGAYSSEVTRAIKAIGVIIVIMGAVALFISGNFERVKTASRFTGIYAFMLVCIIAWSVFLWIINLESIDFILRGVAKFMYQFLVLLIIFSGVYLFGERAIYTTFYGIALGNTIIMAMNLATFGPVESLNSVIMMITGGGEQTGFVRAMEIHDVTFTFGFFIIYFLFFARHNKERVACLLISVFYFLLGWKRIAMAALPAALFLGIILGRMKPKTRKGFMKFVMWMIVIGSFGYIVITNVGIFEQITDYLGLDTMGRNEVYNYIKQYYSISIGFVGYGFEYTTVLLQKIAAANPEAHIGVSAIHNNILTVYIELGFVGFWAWIVYTLVFQLNWMINHWGEKTAMLFFMCEIYIFMTYTTDNTLYYFYTSLVLRLMPMAYAFHKPTEQDIRYWPWVKERKIT
ncbi:MAG: hypothetical protein LUF26_00185 [Firmicutes bacterium]|nr:hypothetical protein [Bacillota bacterium]